MTILLESTLNTQTTLLPTTTFLQEVGLVAEAEAEAEEVETVNALTETQYMQ